MKIYEVVPIDKNAPVIVQKISDIKSWKGDIDTLGKQARLIPEQQHRETRESIKRHPAYLGIVLHDFSFGPKLTKLLEQLTAQLTKHCPDGSPAFESHPAWADYIKIYTDIERQAIDNALQQRSFKRAIVLELEEVYNSNPDNLTTIQKENLESRRKNEWLHALVNDLPALQIVSQSDVKPYLNMLEVAPLKRKAKLKAKA